MQSPAVIDQSNDLNHAPAQDTARTTAQVTAQALDLLQREARLHDQQINETSLLGKAFTGVSEFWHHSGDTGTRVDDLTRRIQADLAAGKSADAAKLAASAREVVDADQAALKSRSQIAGIGAGTVQAAGLFMAGRRGFLVAGAAAALDNIKPNSSESLGEQLTDIGLGITRATVLKGTYAAAGKFNLGMATTAVGLGVTSRFTDLTLNRKTYLDETTGAYDSSLGLQRVVAGTTDAGALTSDIVSLIVARGALGKLNQATEGALLNNKIVSNMAVGAVFGLTKGSSDEVIRQTREGVFQPGEFASRTLFTGFSGLAGAGLGGVFSPRTVATNFGGAHSREYVISGGNTSPDVASRLASSQSAFSFLKVREVKPGGGLAPEQNMLVQHGGENIPIKTELAAKADVIASCNANCLPEGLRSKHIMPSLQSSLWLTQKGNHISFADRRIGAFTVGEAQPVALGKSGPVSVSEILRNPTTLDKLNNKGVHDLGLYADVLKGFKVPAKRVIMGGADSVVLELADESILKITHQTWRPEWGFRTYRNAQGQEVRFDARIIGKPQTFDRPDGMATYYIQERAVTDVRESTVPIFAHRLQQDGRWAFWDRDYTQLGTVPLKDGGRGLVLLDYDAVRAPHLVPKDLKVPHEDRFTKEDRFDRW